MLDLVFVLATLGFFAAALGFASWLDRLDAKETP
jgi:hypothetical protein